MPPTRAARSWLTPMSGLNTNWKNGPIIAAHTTTNANSGLRKPRRSCRNPYSGCRHSAVSAITVLTLPMLVDDMPSSSSHRPMNVKMNCQATK